MHFEYAFEGAFDNRSRRGTVGWLAGLWTGTGTVVTTEPRASRAHWLTATVITPASIATAATRASAFEAAEFTTPRRTVEPRRTLVTTLFKPRAGIAARTITAATTATATTTTTTFPIARFTFDRSTWGGFVADDLVTRTVTAKELITPIGKVVAFGLIATAGFCFRNMIGGGSTILGTEVVALAAVAARATIPAGRPAV